MSLRKKYRRLSMNDFLNILLDLGFWVWAKLPVGIQQQMLNPHKQFTRRQKEQMKIRTQLENIAQNMRIDSWLSLGLPTPVKETIRREAALRKMRMSPYVREKLGMSAFASERVST